MERVSSACSARQHNLEPQPVLERFVSEDDHLTLEDEMARIRLEGNIDAQAYVTGMLVREVEAYMKGIYRVSCPILR